MAKRKNSPQAPLLSPSLASLMQTPQSGPDSIGVDEAGRGCIAGPVVAAAVCLPEGFALDGLTDSKQLTKESREEFAGQIKQRALAWGVGAVWQGRIDQTNILLATFEAMAKAVCMLYKRGKASPRLLLVDGCMPIPDAVLAKTFSKAGLDLRPPLQRSIAGGDASVLSISAASVLAKTWRDQIMESLARRWPVYGFEQHKGYATQTHCRRIQEYGPCPLHRKSFKRGALEAVPNQLSGLEEGTGPQGAPGPGQG